MKLIALIPALNPDDKLVTLTNNLKKNNFDVIVVNDGSNSTSIFDKLDVNKVLTHNVNKGKGAALKTGLKYIKNNYKEEYIVVTIDCDGQHKIEDALKLVELNKKNMSSLIIGSRRLNESVPLRSKIGNSITRKIYSLVTKVDIYDTQSGLRSFSNKLIDEMLNIEGERYEYEINVLLYLSSKNIDIKEITIETIYLNNNSSSHFNPIKDSIKIYKEIFKFSLSSILSFIIDYILFTILTIISKSIIISNIVARLISATFNYTFNKHLVFKKSNKYSLIKYILLAILILILNTSILTIFVNIGINKYIAKLITEILLFIISYLVEKNIVFRK